MFSRQSKLWARSGATLDAVMDFHLKTDQRQNVTEQANIRVALITDTAALELNTAPVLDVLTIDQELLLVRRDTKGAIFTKRHT